MAPENPRILVVEDSMEDYEAVVTALRRAMGLVTFERVDTLEGVEKALNSSHWTAIVSDYMLPSCTAFGVMALLKTLQLDLPLIVISGSTPPGLAASFLREDGVHGYVEKDELELLAPRLLREVVNSNMRDELRRLKKSQEDQERVQETLKNATEKLGEFMRAMPDRVDRKYGVSEEIEIKRGMWKMLWDNPALVALVVIIIALIALLFSSLGHPIPGISSTKP